MKKQKLLCVTSLVLSAMMLIFSLPIAASPMGDVTVEDLTSTEAALEETTQSTENTVIDRLSGKEELTEAETNANARVSAGGYYSYTNVTRIPNGVYALQNYGNSGLWMDIEGDSTEPGMHMQQFAYSMSPADGSSLAGLYRITQYGDTDRYIIRAMLNESLSFGIVGNEVLTKTIPASDADVTDADTFYIEARGDEYAIKPYGSSQYIGANDTDASGWAGRPDSYLIPQNLTTNLYQNLWVLQSKNIDIEAGVYAFQNKAHPSRWMDTEGDSYNEGYHIQQYDYQLSPAMTFSRGGLFKIAPYGNTGYYVIRLMTNNYLSFYRDGNEFLTHEIHQYDDQVNLTDTFSIQFYHGGYVIRPYGSSYCITSNHETASGWPDRPDSYLVPEVYETAGARACWKMEKYTDIDQWEAIVERPEALIAGDQATFLCIAASSTKQDVAATFLYIKEGAEHLVTTRWGNSSRELRLTLHDEGTFRFEVTFENASRVVEHTEYRDYAIELSIDEGVYFFQNASLGKYMQVDREDAANGYDTSGAVLELFPLDGGDYQKFTLEHVGDGYYKIITTCGKVLSIHEDYVNNTRHVWQAFYLGENYQRWKFTRTGRGTYVIRLQASEPYATDWCMSVQAGVTDGPNVEQKEYTNDTNYVDEWNMVNIIKPLPRSGYELEYNPSLWNYGDVQTHANCYSYCLNNQVYPRTNELWYQQQPGEEVGYFFEKCEITGELIKDYAAADAQSMGFSFTEVDKNTRCSPYTYKVALVVDPGNDYHWYRQNADGTWSHKRGNGPVINTDASGNIIYDPETANRSYSGLNYSQFVGYYEITPLNNLYIPTRSVNIGSSIDHIEFQPNKINLPTYSMVQNIQVGMLYSEVTELIGLPQRMITSGVVVVEYEIDNGTVLQVEYVRNVEREYVVNSITMRNH